MITFLPNLPYYHASFDDACMPLLVLLAFFGFLGVARDFFNEDSIWNELFNAEDTKTTPSVLDEIERI